MDSAGIWLKLGAFGSQAASIEHQDLVGVEHRDALLDGQTAAGMYQRHVPRRQRDGDAGGYQSAFERFQVE